MAFGCLDNGVRFRMAPASTYWHSPWQPRARRAQYQKLFILDSAAQSVCSYQQITPFQEAVKNYDGSWTEWGNMVGMPVARP